MSKIEESLRLLAMSRGYIISPVSWCDGYRVRPQKDCDYPVTALYDGKWRYFVEGVYNSSEDAIEIDMEELEKLKEYCEALS